MKLKALRQRAAELKAEIVAAQKARADIGDKAIAEKRKLNDDERAMLASKKTEIEALEAQQEDVAEMLRAAEAANEADRTAPSVADADAQAADAAAGAGGVRQVQVKDRTKEKGFFGRFLQAVHSFGASGSRAQTPKADLDVLREMQGAATGMNSDVPSEGGFAVTQDRSGAILQRTYSVGEILRLITPIPLSANSNGLKLPAVDETSRADSSRFGGIVSGWLGQGNTLSSGKPKLREMDLKLRKVGAFVYSTDELLADAAALEAWISKFLPMELAFRVEDAIINGDGSNKPSGIINSGAAVTVTRNTASRIIYDDVSAMWKRMWAPLRRNSVWLVDQSCEQDLEQLSIAIGTAGVLAPVYKPAGVTFGPDGTQGYSPATLYGRPILTTEYGAALGTVGDIILTNFDEYTLVDKGGVDQAVSIHVAFLTDESVFRFIYRVDGQSNWNAALTPKSGGATLSPIVTLT
jgi:HK97 family phage major capsid protein